MKVKVLFFLLLLIELAAKSQEGYKLVIDYQFDFASDFSSNGLARVKKGDNKTAKWGFINEKGKLIIDYQYRFALDFSSNGLASVKDSKTYKWGYIDSKGEIVIDYQFDYASPFSPNGLACIKMGDYETGKYGYINEKGEIVIDCKFDGASDFSSNGLAKVRKGDFKTGKYGYINEKGDIVIDYLYEDADDFSPNGLAKVSKSKNLKARYGYINKKGEVVIDFQYFLAESFSVNGLASVYDLKTHNWGYIDKNNDVVIDSKFDWAESFSSNGLACVIKGRPGFGKSGYINERGEIVIDYQYDWAGQFSSNGLACVRKGKWNKGKYGYIKLFTLAEIQEYVQNRINKWRKKGEFEKTKDYIIRVNEKNHKHKVDEFTQIALNLLKKKEAEKYKSKDFKLNKYDADNETFLITTSNNSQFTISVPISEAPSLKKSWNRVSVKNIDFYVKDNSFVISKFDIVHPSNNKVYKYDSQISSTYNSGNIEYEFTPVDINLSKNKVTKGSTISKSENILLRKSSIDTNIPETNIRNLKTFALIIGNENYKNEISVPHAKNDAQIFSEYCKKTLGIPNDQVHLLTDGTYGQILGELKWITDIINAFEGGAKVIFYYAGHGMPNYSNKSAYILPVDGNASITQTAIKLDDIYSQLGRFPSKSVNIFLDACFSGAARNGMLTKGRGVRIAPKENILKGKLAVISAASGNETALPYEKKGHGLFTYFLLKKLNDSKGNITLGELSRYIIRNVKQQSIIINRKSQTPNVRVSSVIENRWKELKL